MLKLLELCQVSLTQQVTVKVIRNVPRENHSVVGNEIKEARVKHPKQTSVVNSGKGNWLKSVGNLRETVQVQPKSCPNLGKRNEIHIPHLTHWLRAASGM